MGLTFEARWEDALPDYINHVRSCRAPRTVDYYRTTLAQLYDWTAERGIGLNDMTRKRMEEYINYRADKGLAANTIHHDKVVARAFFKFARQEGYIKGRPLQNLDMRKPAPVERYCPTEEDIAALLEAVPRKWRIRSNPGVASLTPNQRAFFAKRDLCVISGLVATACRISELLALTVSDLDMERGEVRIRQSKGRRPRSVLFGPWEGFLAAWLEVRPDVESDFLIISDTGGPVSRTWMSKKVTAYAVLAGLKNVSAHSLRHYAGTKIALVNPLAAQRTLGHQSLSTTMTYVHTVPEDVRAAYQIADPLGRAMGRKKVPDKKRRII